MIPCSPAMKCRLIRPLARSVGGNYLTMLPFLAHYKLFLAVNKLLYLQNIISVCCRSRFIIRNWPRAQPPRAFSRAFGVGHPTVAWRERFLLFKTSDTQCHGQWKFEITHTMYFFSDSLNDNAILIFSVFSYLKQFVMSMLPLRNHLQEIKIKAKSFTDTLVTPLSV